MKKTFGALNPLRRSQTVLHRHQIRRRCCSSKLLIVAASLIFSPFLLLVILIVPSFFTITEDVWALHFTNSMASSSSSVPIGGEWG
ncbi:hypothetical protein L6452_08380 [Arctium lappa]|uniref:Uncharacterized protein n=1 Tax=Arctium lappa TaxID=4217 RepID=A0ACB9DHG8_ARCLA|nr:hypothetical protein L6452_08380 [Arctium lappa]